MLSCDTCVLSDACNEAKTENFSHQLLQSKTPIFIISSILAFTHNGDGELVS